MGKRKAKSPGDRKRGAFFKNRQAAPVIRASKARAVAMAKETGYVDVATATYALDTTGTVTLLNTVAQGVAVTQRVGKKIMMKGLQCRGNLQANTTAGLNDVAYMIVYDKRPTGALPAVTDILVAATANSMNNDNNAGRFQILKRCDETLIGNATFTGAVANALTEVTQKDADWYLDLKGKEVVYKAVASGAIADIEQGALYLVTVGNSVAGTAAAIAALAFRLRFWDS